MSDTSARYLPFIEFLCLNREALLVEPYRGDVNTIRLMFKAFAGKSMNFRDVISVSGFLSYLESFNTLSNNALVFGTLLFGNKILSQIKMVNIKLLQRRLKEHKPLMEVSVKFTKGETPNGKFLKLLEVLELPLHNLGVEQVEGEEVIIYDLDRVCDIIAKPTATEILGIERAKLLTPKKPFYEVCEIASHNQALANLCLNSKTIGQSVQDLPSNPKIHKIIASCKSLLSKDVINCVKSKVHFLPLITNSTDLYLGNCSYLDTCHKLKSCRYLHYYTLNPLSVSEKDKPGENNKLLALDYTIGECYNTMTKKELPPQWIKCDVRYLPFSILGKFAAIISDPAWDIHMSLPYGTCKDSELLSLPMNELQDEGILFLWVTGRSIEIGRKALAQWGYTVSDEMIWIKLNQLRRTIVTGRTGHWLNHSKEHLLVGIKGNPLWLNRKIDLDIIVSGTRETLRKPDELYGIIDRLVGKHARKLEIFGRDNNIRPGWLSKLHLASYHHIFILTYSNWKPGDRNFHL